MSFSRHISKYIFRIVILSLFTGPAHAFIGKYPIQNFTTSDYKAGIQNIDFAQNRDMTLFVANNLGVLAFNGNEWETHAFKTGKKQRSLAFDDTTNRLYIGSQGEFGFFEKNWNYISLINKIPEDFKEFDEVWDVFILHSKVYFCTFQGIYVYDGQSIKVISVEEGLDRSFLVNGKLFTQTSRGQLLEMNGDELTASYPQGQKDQILAGIIPQDDGLLLFYNSGTIEYANFFGVTSDEYQTLSAALQGKYVNHVLQLSDSRLAISTQTAGLFLYDLQQQTMEHITKQDGLQTNACLRAFQDFAGDLWVGMQNGLAIIDINSPIRLINQEIDIQGSGYEAFETDGGTYYTTSNGIYFSERGAAKSIFLSGTEGPAYGMQEISGKLYAGHHTGLFILEDRTARRVAATDGLWQIKPLHSQPGYAIGGTYSGLYLFQVNKNMELEAVQKIAGFNESSRFFEEDQKGRIWVGQFYKGLYRLQLEEQLTSATVKKISVAEELPINEQIILSSCNNEIQIATRSGIYKLDQTSDRIVRSDFLFDEIGPQPVYLLVQDRQKNIHVYADNKVGYFRQISASNYQYIPSSLFQLRYSFNNDLLHISVNTSKGVLFNANEGFIFYDPALEGRTLPENPLVISRVYSVTEDSVLYSRKPFASKPDRPVELAIKQKTKVLQFHVESFQFQDVNNQQFRYYLKGFDEDYGPWTNSTTKEYTNLTAGDYEFIVDIRNALGEITSSKPLLLRVTPPFYKSLWAKALYLIVVIWVLLLLFRMQQRHYKQKAVKIEEGKQAALAAKQQELIEVEQRKEEELLQLEEAKMKSELDHLNQLLAASTMNLVVKNEFMETIREDLNEVKQKGKNVETKRALEKIVREIDTTLRLQEDWEQFKHHFDRVHGDFLGRLRNQFVDLTPNEQKLSAFLRLNLDTKEIANLMGISIRGVEVARYRLRKKLDLEKGQNLTKFILEY
ncbi:hypothetical protein [Flavilitoribacter nigricans]|uniref:HTH luxR-type domain-containing protein n=1 Tax=Flavilitoribacter nigricans (strain ATCC 23147 / DSM 23189 / NBRC 102662 / NCIMB 1420 / SS-2) TaxID=1122177 RepID=A0A2D0N3G0_FLAN2|nr:hypothetical protein [Flavilitoribacter nigricans]PHN02916.1 hypothetical protein CRP01_29355 [Flavilitoribacter nigricans DSM 23189 = NBRC 102662]